MVADTTDEADRVQGSSKGRVEGSPREIAGASLVAFILAALVLVVAVLPMGYGLDPVGTGALFGWGPDLEEEDHSHGARTDDVDLVLSPGHTLRWGFEVQEGAWLDYRWNASMALNATVLIESAEGREPMVIDEPMDPVDNMSGGFRVPFEGRVVFSWSSPEDARQEAEVSLWTSGSYRLLGALR